MYVLTIGIHVFYIVPIHNVDDVSKKDMGIYIDGLKPSQDNLKENYQ